jgi:SNF2 family DNA or RNA helicase
MKWIPKKYQEEALAFALEHEYAQLWLDKGLGKTSVALHAIADLMDRLEVSRVLVVSTRRITKNVWPSEVAKWDSLKHLPIRDIEGSPKRRSEMLDEPYYGIETITFEKLTWLFGAHLGRRGVLPWDMVIFDESSKLKQPGTRRFRSLRAWQDKLPRTLNLTGSPAPSGLLNVWAPTFLLDAGERLGRTYTRYRDTWFATDFMGWKFEPVKGALEHIHKQLSDITLSMSAKDYLDLPPLVVNDIWLPFPDEAEQPYRQLEREMFLDLERGTVEVANGGVLTGKCRQIANGALYLNGESKEWQIIHDKKIEALDEILEEAMGRNIIVAYQFKSDLARLRAKYPTAAVLVGKDDHLIDEWNEGQHSMLILHPASAGHGLNLQDGGCDMVMFGMPWSFDQYDQCVDRIAGGLRRERPTFIHRILVECSVERAVVNSLNNNCTVQEALRQQMKLSAVA